MTAIANLKVRVRCHDLVIDLWADRPVQKLMGKEELKTTALSLPQVEVCIPARWSGGQKQPFDEFHLILFSTCLDVFPEFLCLIDTSFFL